MKQLQEHLNSQNLPSMKQSFVSAGSIKSELGIGISYYQKQSKALIKVSLRILSSETDDERIIDLYEEKSQSLTQIQNKIYELEDLNKKEYALIFLDSEGTEIRNEVLNSLTLNEVTVDGIVKVK